MGSYSFIGATFVGLIFVLIAVLIILLVFKLIKQFKRKRKK